MLSDQVFWSGYEVEQQTFRDIVSKLRGISKPPETPLSRIYMYYSTWVEKLPPKDRAKVPRVRVREADPEVDEITHIFFPLRWIPFKSSKQMDDPAHPDYATIHEPTETDEKKLERWLNLVNSNLEGENRVQKDIFKFAAMQDLHPLVDPRPF